MDIDYYTPLIVDLCAKLDLPDANHVLETRSIQVEGFDVRLDHFDDDTGLYILFEFGAVAPERMLGVYRLMLEANVLVYAQDQAQLGVDRDTGNSVLIARAELPELNGETLAEMLAHYAEHSRYWQQNFLRATDEQYQAVVSDASIWIRA
ncbi:CesT family type III secretion system chaperone [Paraburkholderia strydomiana]|uniref:CesT family type III secretion system chaperone n=1 Tax=Paraburkholderia strydomiana TaxID=1245417 RepID=UPI0028627B48|nr:CesT family type III secretion system chaperone [Paraburkholderia strydomiana]MDR7009904.1 hypothetical protein [Paraburkholderia strydomiana]